MQPLDDPDFVDAAQLTHAGALKILHAAIEHARHIGAPVTISVCDASGVLLAMCRMDGAFFLSVELSMNKAMTAAATGVPTGALPDPVAMKLGMQRSGNRLQG